MCLCSTVHELAKGQNVGDVPGFAADLNKHLSDVRTILLKSKSLTRDVHYSVVSSNQRTMKILNSHHIDFSSLNRLCQTLQGDLHQFWDISNTQVHREVRRRIACVIVFLRSRLDAQEWLSPAISSVVGGQKLTELRHAGRKYIKIARKLGGIGSLLWLPNDVPSSTYERYLHIDDEETFEHLRRLGEQAPDYNSLVQRLISTQFSDSALERSKYNLLVEFNDLYPKYDLLLLFASSFGELDLPVDLLRSAKSPQRRWTADGEIESLTATDYDLNSALIDTLSDEDCIAEIVGHPAVTEIVLEDGTIAWKIQDQSIQGLGDSLTPETKTWLADQVLKLICYACPPCFEGKVNWPAAKKKAIWELLNRRLELESTPLASRPRVIEALLFFCERDTFSIRRSALDRAKQLLHKSMPWQFHASVALFESILSRIEGNFDKSNTVLIDILKEPNGSTRFDNALRGRLHISHLENKVHLYDDDISSYMYLWEGIQPLSTFEIEVTRRLQGLAAKYFHSVGDFKTAQASLEQHLWLNSTQPIRPNTRILMGTRLAEIHCELEEYDKALDIVQTEIDRFKKEDRHGRPFRRLSLVKTDACIGLGRLDVAELTLQELMDIEPPNFDDLNDQVIHMRRVLLVARTAHKALRFEEALASWNHVRERMNQLSIFQARHRWTAVIIHLSLAHCHISLGNEVEAEKSWTTALELSQVERCEYVIPVLATIWLPEIVNAIHSATGWPFRVMRPGGKRDITWP